MDERGNPIPIGPLSPCFGEDMSLFFFPIHARVRACPSTKKGLPFCSFLPSFLPSLPCQPSSVRPSVRVRSRTNRLTASSMGPLLEPTNIMDQRLRGWLGDRDRDRGSLVSTSAAAEGPLRRSAVTCLCPWTHWDDSNSFGSSSGILESPKCVALFLVSTVPTSRYVARALRSKC